MEKRVHFYVSRKNVLTWLMALCLVGSAVARIVIPCLKGSEELLNVWSQIVLPVSATLLFVLITLLAGKDLFYKTAIPVAMMVIYFGIRPHIFLSQFHPFVVVLYHTCLLFYFLLYTIITSGRLRYGWLLLPLFLIPVGGLIYLHESLYSMPELPMNPWFYVIADYLLFLGGLFLTFAVKVHPQEEFHPTWGDRSDGRRIRSLPPIAQVSPYIMTNRNGASNYFEESFEITHIDRYIRQKRKEGMTDFGITHVLLAAYCRGIAKFPGLNRFLAGQKVFSRGTDLQYCMVVKKEMSVDSPDTAIKVHLSPYDTSSDVYKKLSTAVESVKHPKLDSGFDNLAMWFTMIPGVFLKFFVWLLKTLDYFGCLPKILLELSPFHGSLFFTSMGSLGIKPIYHHLYDFGNLPVFGAFGCKRRALELQDEGEIVQRKYIDMKFTIDERIVDGYYYAAFFKYFRRILMHPEQLDNPPDEVVKDID